MSQPPAKETLESNVPEKSWLARNMTCIIIVSVIFVLGGTLIATPIFCCAGGGLMMFNVFKKPVEVATQALNDDSRVTDKIGSPIEYESIGVNNLESTNGNGSADVNFPVKGPEGTASVTGKVTQSGGEWSVQNLTVTFEDGSKVEIPETQ